MKTFRLLLSAAACLLFAAGSAGAAPELPFLTADPAAGSQNASKLDPGAVTNSMSCSFRCQDGSLRTASCSASIETCCQIADRFSCSQRGGLAGGTCNDNGTLYFC